MHINIKYFSLIKFHISYYENKYKKQVVLKVKRIGNFENYTHNLD